jgi:type IV fimbrial biogenesis protein FimT
MITVAVAGIVMGIGVPSFTSLITSNRLTAIANDLVASLSLARNEAIKRGMQVTVRRKGPNSAEWEFGWDVFSDSDGSDTFNDNGDANLCEIGEDCLLKTYDALPSGYTLRTGGTTQDYAAYMPNGLRKGVANDTFRLCNGTDTIESRAIIINVIGRARVSTGTSSCP